MIPTRNEAEMLLQEAGKMNPGPWESHSRYVAYYAQKIAENCDGMDPEKAYIVGLLHDIGRRFGWTYIAHVIDGYNFLMEKGYDEPARICLTHSFNVKDINTYIGKKDISDEQYSQIENFLHSFEYDDYDRLIQLCDSFVLPTGPVSLDERMDDVEKRYGYYPEIKRNNNYKLKKYFEDKMNKSLESLFD